MPSMLFGVLWFLSCHPRHGRVECDGNGKNFLLLLVFYENIEFSITRFYRATKLPRKTPQQHATQLQCRDVRKPHVDLR